MSKIKSRWKERYARVIYDGGHKVFFERFLNAKNVKELMIVTPWITSLKNEPTRLEHILNKINKEKIKTSIFMRSPEKEPINREASEMFRNSRHIRLFFNNELHAKVYCCTCSPSGFALVSSANLSSMATRAYEIGIIVEGRGHGTRIISELNSIGISLSNRAGTHIAR